jgi:hypothetical protein
VGSRGSPISILSCKTSFDVGLAIVGVTSTLHVPQDQRLPDSFPSIAHSSDFVPNTQLCLAVFFFITYR